jgi:hypothetical protein
MPAPLVADAVKPTHVRDGATPAASRTAVGKKIWIDLENTPRIPSSSPSSANWNNAATRF